MEPHRAPLVLALCLLVAACGHSARMATTAPGPSAEPAPEASAPQLVALSPPAADSAAPTPSAPASSASAAAAPSEPPPHYPKGILGEELLSAFEVEAPPPEKGPLLAQAAECMKAVRKDPKSASGTCDYATPSILGLHPDKGLVAFLEDDTNDERDGDCTRVYELLVPLGAPEKSTRRSPPFPHTGSCPNDSTAPSAPAELAAQLHDEGFVDAPNLIKGGASLPFGAWAYSPLAALRAPLRDFLLRADDANSNKMKIDLITPDNARSIPLGSVPLKDRDCVEFGSKGCLKTAPFHLPTLLAVSLSPDQKKIIVLLKLNSPIGHDTSARYTQAIFPLPKGTLP